MPIKPSHGINTWPFLVLTISILVDVYYSEACRAIGILDWINRKQDINLSKYTCSYIVCTGLWHGWIQSVDANRVLSPNLSLDAGTGSQTEVPLELTPVTTRSFRVTFLKAGRHGRTKPSASSSSNTSGKSSQLSLGPQV